MPSLSKVIQIVSSSAVALLLAATARPAAADSFNVSYLAPGVQASSDSTYVESFDAATLSGNTLTTHFNGSSVTGTYTGNFSLSNPNVYGGAGGAGKYITTSSSYTLSLSSNVNYFGLWFSALDNGNQLAFYQGSTLVFSFSPANYAALVGACPTSAPSPNFCGNPNPSQAGNNAQQYAFLNFFDSNGVFNKVVFTESPQVGGFESDNHTLGMLTTTPGGTQVTPTPEPSTFALLGTGLLGAAGTLRRKLSRG